MAAKLDLELDQSFPGLNKTLIFLGGTVAISSLVYLFVKGRDRGNHSPTNMDENGPTEPQQVEDEEKLTRKVLMLGLDSSGKSSILKALQMDSMKVSEEDMAPTPTEGFHVVCLQTGTVELNIWEIGGAEKMRSYWNNFTHDCDILVYVIDSTSDDQRLTLAGGELQRVLDDTAMDDVPLIILANKQDQEGAKEPQDLLTSLHLSPASIENRQFCQLATQVPYQGVIDGLDTFQAILTEH